MLLPPVTSPATYKSFAAVRPSASATTANTSRTSSNSTFAPPWRASSKLGLVATATSTAEAAQLVADASRQLEIVTEQLNEAKVELQRQQVAVGRALMTKPRLLMLDEPTAGVSPIVMDELFDRIIAIARGGLPVLMVEQNAQQAMNIADKAYVLVQGANAHTGTGKELMANDEVRRTFLGG